MAEIKRRSEKYEKKEEVKEIPVTIEEIEENSHNILKNIVLIMLILIIGLLCYSTLIEPKLLTVREYKIESSTLPNSFDGVKIVQFSDLHYGTSINKNELKRIVNKINDLKPDIIFFTGDLIDKNINPNDDIRNEIREELNRLEASLYKYAIYGDEDTDEYMKLLEDCNFKVLNNEATLLYYKDEMPIHIIGFNIIDSNPDYNILNDSINDIGTTNLYKIVLIHEPDNIDKFINYDPNVVMAGHTMGRLINIPLFNMLFVNNSKYYDDYTMINNTSFYISNGLGTSGLSSRLNDIPSVSLYRLYKANEEITS